jgi:hypothetical protein
MDELDLHDLGREPLGPAGEPRPVGDVVRRGRHLRRRAAVARAVPIVVLVAALAAGAGALVPRGEGAQPDVEVSSPPGDATLPLGGPVVGCTAGAPGHVAPDEVDPALRLAPDPDALPGGADVASLVPRRLDDGACVDIDPALVLHRVDGAAMTGEIALWGPFAEAVPVGERETTDPGRLDGRDASQPAMWSDWSQHAALTWTEPDGRSWLLEGSGTDEATVLAVAAGLVLDGRPTEGDPAAALPPDAVPSGFEVAWQAPGLPAVELAVREEWVVTTEPPFLAGGCEVVLRTTARSAPVALRPLAFPDGRAERVEVRGVAGIAVEEPGNAAVYWQEAAGVAGQVTCASDVATVVRVAESLDAVDTDDPRVVAGLAAGGED